MVDFLGWMHKRFIVQGLAPTPKPDDDQRFPKWVSDYFKGMKRDVIIVLTLLIAQDKDVQNTIRGKGGISLILAQTNIDDDNPCKFRDISKLIFRYQRESHSLYQSSP